VEVGGDDRPGAGSPLALPDDVPHGSKQPFDPAVLPGRARLGAQGSGHEEALEEIIHRSADGWIGWRSEMVITFRTGGGGRSL